MPFIITTWHNEDAAPTPIIPKPRDARVAVATLEEARTAVLDIATKVDAELYDDAPNSRLQTAIRAMQDTAGSFGPLDDGTVIEVAPATWQELGHMIPAPGAANDDPLYDGITLHDTLRADVMASNRAALIDAYNAQQ